MTIRECYYPAGACDYHENEECYAPVRKHLQCQMNAEDDALMSEWERMHEPPDNRCGEKGE